MSEIGDWRIRVRLKDTGEVWFERTARGVSKESAEAEMSRLWGESPAPTQPERGWVAELFRGVKGMVCVSQISNLVEGE